MPGYKDQIPDYLEGHLTAEEMAAFNTQLQSDKELQQAVADYRKVRETLGKRKLAEFQQKLEIAKDAHRQKKTGTRPKWRGWILAIIVLLLIAVGIWAVSTFSTPSPEQVIAAHFQEFEPGYILPPANPKRDAQEDTAVEPSRMSVARAAFSERNFEQALQLMRAVPQASRGDAYHYELGVLYLLLQQPDAAVEALRQSNSAFEGGRNWYLAIALLQSGERELSKAQLETIIDNPSSIAFWREKAKTMLSAMR